MEAFQPTQIRELVSFESLTSILDKCWHVDSRQYSFARVESVFPVVRL